MEKISESKASDEVLIVALHRPPAELTLRRRSRRPRPGEGRSRGGTAAVLSSVSPIGVASRPDLPSPSRSAYCSSLASGQLAAFCWGGETIPGQRGAGSARWVCPLGLRGRSAHLTARQREKQTIRSLCLFICFCTDFSPRATCQHLCYRFCGRVINAFSW